MNRLVVVNGRQSREFRFDYEPHRDNLRRIELVAQISHITKVKHRTFTHKCAAPDMAPDQPLPFQIRQRATQLVACDTEVLFGLPLRQKTSVPI